jgi:ketosteroid isomerase-like protein
VTATGDRLEQIAHELAIRDIVASYADAVIRKDADAWRETWAEDATWIVGGRVTEGREAVVAQWIGLMSLFEFIAQYPQHGRIQVDGDRATGRWYVNELGRPHAGEPNLTMGVYHDTYARLAPGWRFRRRRFDLLYVGAPDLSGQVFPFRDEAE